jgi:hypothetical protein
MRCKSAIRIYLSVHLIKLYAFAKLPGPNLQALGLTCVYQVYTATISVPPINIKFRSIKIYEASHVSSDSFHKYIGFDFNWLIRLVYLKLNLSMIFATLGAKSRKMNRKSYALLKPDYSTSKTSKNQPVRTTQPTTVQALLLVEIGNLMIKHTNTGNRFDHLKAIYKIRPSPVGEKRLTLKSNHVYRR